MARPKKGEEKFDLAKLAPKLEQAGALGYSAAQLARLLKVNIKTLYRWRENPEFAEMYADYMTNAEAYWVDIHAAVAAGDRKGDAKLIMHRMTSQFRERGEWAPPTRVELTGKDGGPIETKMNESQVDAKIAALTAQYPELMKVSQ
jgi:hypothetical protein